MASKPLTTMTSRISLLPRSIASYSSSLSPISRRASSRSLSSFSRHQCYRGFSPSLLTAARRTGYYASLPNTTGKQTRWESSSSNNQSSESSSLPEIKSYQFNDINPTNQILIDVRQPPELLSTGIIPTAVSIPIASHPDAYFLTPSEFLTRFGFPKPGFEDQEHESDPSAPPQLQQGEKIVFYCKAGVRARAAAQLAVKAGYKPENLGVYDGSWLDWERKGGKVERWDGDE